MDGRIYGCIWSKGLENILGAITFSTVIRIEIGSNLDQGFYIPGSFIFSTIIEIKIIQSPTHELPSSDSKRPTPPEIG